MENILDINARLLGQFGKDLYGNVKYRLVWSNNQLERKFGTYEDYSESGDIFLREVTEVREVPKYPHDPDRWVLENIRPNEVNTELQAKLSYEPVWIFKNKTGPVEPQWWAIELIIKMHRATERVKLNQSDIDAKEEARMAMEKLLFKTMLQNDSPIIPTMVSAGAGVFVPSNYEGSKS